jgi:hypothetical protein
VSVQRLQQYNCFLLDDEDMPGGVIAYYGTALYKKALVGWQSNCCINRHSCQLSVLTQPPTISPGLLAGSAAHARHTPDAAG